MAYPSHNLKAVRPAAGPTKHIIFGKVSSRSFGRHVDTGPQNRSLSRSQSGLLNGIRIMPITE
jgi:hypothetical protein